MTLWNLIRDFFVQNVFGGITSEGVEYTRNVVGAFTSFADNTQDDYWVATLDEVMFKVTDNNGSGFAYLIGFADWLSTTFTIITLILLVMFLYIFVKWIFKLFSGLLH